MKIYEVQKNKYDEVFDIICEELQSLKAGNGTQFLYGLGSVFTSLSCESWSDGGEYECQFDGKFEYVFSLRGDIDCHVVDYGLDGEFSRSYYEALGTSPDYRAEREVLVPHGTLFKVVDVDTYLCPDGITRSFVELTVAGDKF